MKVMICAGPVTINIPLHLHQWREREREREYSKFEIFLLIKIVSCAK